MFSYNAIDILYLQEEHNINKGGHLVAFVDHVMLAHWWKNLLAC